MEDTVRVRPADLAKPLMDSVRAVLDETYLDKVIADVGLVVATYDIEVPPRHVTGPVTRSPSMCEQHLVAVCLVPDHYC